MKEWQVFTHLESCPGPSPKKKPAERTAPLGLSLQPRQHNTNLERLPALNYSMLKDNALRKRMAELGISSQGSRSLLERRHKEYITIWNANCDAARPKSRYELLRQLDAWERSQGGRAPIVGRAVQNAAVIKDKDFDGSAWATQHNDSFKDLIASARKTSQAARQKAKDDDPDTTKQQAGASTTETAALTNSTVPSHPEGVPASGPPGEPSVIDAGDSRPPDQPTGEPEIRDGPPNFYPPPTATYCDPAL
jgi:E3 ubiquitin-protein ligase RAD18